ncbi:MAG: CHAP domain-containing protein [Patescibacteria group bacterium]
MLHIFRNYSALIVVISSAILVAATNFAAGKESSGFLFGYFGAEDNYNNPLENKMSIQANQQKSNLALVKLTEASMSPDPTLPDNADAETVINIQGQALVAGMSPVKQEPAEEGGVTVYKVQPGDTVGSIAAKNNIKINTILWANEIDNIDSIMQGDELFILPTDGLTYTVKEGDKLDDIARKYKADEDKIIAFNSLPANGEIKKDQDIIIPDGQLEIVQPPAPVIPIPTAVNPRILARPYEPFGTANGKRLASANGNSHKFPYGYCTWYVARVKNIPWSGNAGTWLYKAKTYGYATGRTPQPGAVMVTLESSYGHVAVVEKVSSGSITVSEMNFKGFGLKSYRTLAANSRVIKGFIY